MAARPPVRSLAALGTGTGAAIGRHLDLAFRAMARGQGCTEGRGTFRLLTGEPHPFGNFVLLSASADLDSTREAVDPVVAAGAPAAALFPDIDVPAGVHAYLEGHGFVLHGAMPAMGVDITSLMPTTLPDGYQLVRVGDGEDGAEWVRTFAAGYELPIAVAECFSPIGHKTSTSPESALKFFAIRRNGAIVGTSACYLADGVAGIYCVATLPEERRKGLGAHATAEPLRLAARDGFRVGILQSSEAGHGVYKKLGFTDFGGVPLYVRIPPA